MPQSKNIACHNCPNCVHYMYNRDRQSYPHECKNAVSFRTAVGQEPDESGTASNCYYFKQK